MKLELDVVALKHSKLMYDHQGKASIFVSPDE